VVHFQKEIIGIIVDEVSKVTILDNIEETPDILPQQTRIYFSGVANSDEQVIPILNIDEILKTAGDK
jgi:chemotaxis signal transduction protein